MTRFTTLLDIAEDNGWRYEVEDKDTIRFFQSSPAGQDFSFMINCTDEGKKSADALINNLYQYIENYDVSEETYLWLDTSGHGMNGAPYDMRDLYDDMESCKEMMQDLLKEWCAAN